MVSIAAAYNAQAAFLGSDSLELRSVWFALSAGLFVAATDPLRYWPVVLTGLLLRVFPFVARSVSDGPHPVAAVLPAVFAWIPMAAVLVGVYRERLKRLRCRAPEVLDIAIRARTNRGDTVDALSAARPVLLVFLRHAGCTFCREALADLSAQRRAVEAAGATIVLAHMGESTFGREFFGKYGLEDVHQISDPNRGLYKAFGLQRGSLWMLFGPKVWVRGFDAGILKRHGVGRLAGDGFQMPGIFLIFHGQVLRSYRHQSAADRPDYVRFVNEDAFIGMIS